MKSLTQGGKKPNPELYIHSNGLCNIFLTQESDSDIILILISKCKLRAQQLWRHM